MHALMWARAFSPDPDRLNPRGDAIAIGHPLGASGVRLMGTLLNELQATGGRYGYQTMCGAAARPTAPSSSAGQTPGWPASPSTALPSTESPDSPDSPDSAVSWAACAAMSGWILRVTTSHSTTKVRPGTSPAPSMRMIHRYVEASPQGEAARRDEVHDVEVTVTDAGDGELDLVPAEREVQPGEEEEREDEHADDVGHQLVAKERSRQPAGGRAVSGNALGVPHDDRLAIAPCLRPLGRQRGQPGVVGGELRDPPRRRPTTRCLRSDGGRGGRGGLARRRGPRRRSVPACRRMPRRPTVVVVGVDEHPPEGQAEERRRPAT